MKIKLNFNIILILVVSLTYTACKPTENNPVGSAFSIEVTDFRNKKIEFSKKPERIICLIESALSGIYMLSAEDKIIGIPQSVYTEDLFQQYALLDERIKNKKLLAPGNWDFVSIESIVALQPDLVIIWSSQQESIAAIENMGIPVYAVFLKCFADVYKEISDLGKITGTESRADSIINYTKFEIEKIKLITDSIIVKKKIYFMWSQGILETSGKSSTVNELIELAGAINVCNKIEEEHLIINSEKVIEWNPDLIVMWNNTIKTTDDICNITEWESVLAIKNKKVFELPSSYYCDFWTLKFQYTIKLLAKWSYPDKFMNIDIENEKEQMLTNLYGKILNLKDE